ncbi:circadian clock KaiB family protein [Coleofasciculus chthonoplastes]|jgi:circadian clock protein KaiB|uniref:circadian clock KaiB family protein n=1 Tax=Coleofasciculus TaxID=669368 RepID=UPI0032FBE12B
MNEIQRSFSQLFKGIALFTPGGDLIYGIDPSKQEHWHLHLCASLQEMLGLPEPPHFLVPGYTGTIDRWLDPYTQQMRTSAELYPPIQHHQALLNAVFGVTNVVWQVAPWREECCDPIVLETYRDRFPQLWQDHDLIIRCDRPDECIEQLSDANPRHEHDSSLIQSPQSYVLRLFVSGHSGSTEHILKKLHQLLEQSLQHPYTLKVIDVFKHPEQAEANQISATPTLLRVCPPPVRRIVGDLNNLESLLLVLIAPEAQL